MPKVRQPTALQKMALESIFEYVFLCCDRISVKGSLDELNQVISAIKKDVISRIPWFSVADFLARFLERFFSCSRPPMHLKAALEIVMDIEVVGLRCRGPILAYLDPQDSRRLRRLVELDLHRFSCGVPTSVYNVMINLNMNNFYLNDLTSFAFNAECTDLHLSVIARNCPQLQEVRVPNSQEVTDQGLATLEQCSDLRYVDVRGCGITHSGINRMLSVQKKLEKFTQDSLATWSCLDLAVCPWIRYIAFHPVEFSYKDLRKIVTKFPNISYFEMRTNIPINVSSLKSLNKLTGLDLDFPFNDRRVRLNSIWAGIKDLLKFVGTNLTTLKLGSWDCEFLDFINKLGQDDVDFIFNSCPNLESLKFDHVEGLIVIPSFQKLKVLMPCVISEDNRTENPTRYSDEEYFGMSYHPTIEFDKLPNLETLSLYNYRVSVRTIESIMLDNDKFPKLSVIKNISMKDEDLEEIRRIARMNNLEFEIEK
ncbi:uncharacterized protein LOC124416309 [Diprion similis]|uniref:uncharacterized protein LOC124416309 n=1 Tax=Diprion similis TaxID=362088 RepID=UPI001EF77456|nr:uncharacterized protein LOC124416309 [Diprion similis]